MTAPLVFVHGLGCDSHAWDEIVPLCGPHRAVAVELPRGGSLDEIARALAAELRRLAQLPAIVVGHSLGGAVAAHLALVEPAAVRALVIVDMSIAPIAKPGEMEMLRAGLAKNREATLRGWFGALCQPHQLDRLMVGLGKLPDEAILGYVHALTTGPITDGGRGIAVPMLLMASALLLPGKRPRRDELAAVGYAHVERLQVETFDKSKHWIMWDEPDKFIATLTRFLSTVES
jgi:pimeloyl-ACP methyl ester carboxylesterase